VHQKGIGFNQSLFGIYCFMIFKVVYWVSEICLFFGYNIESGIINDNINGLTW
jgi:hypothetical protein